MPAGIYRKFLLALFLLLMLPVISYAQVSKIVFTTEPQTVKPGEISGTITVQLQDSAGSSYKATETVDVEFLSSSASATTETTTEESSTANSTSVNQSSSSSGLSSSHYGAVSLSSLKTLPGFEVSAGRDRLGVAGSPLEFEVETNLEYKN